MKRQLNRALLAAIATAGILGAPRAFGALDINFLVDGGNLTIGPDAVTISQFDSTIHLQDGQTKNKELSLITWTYNYSSAATADHKDVTLHLTVGGQTLPITQTADLTITLFGGQNKNSQELTLNPPTSPVNFVFTQNGKTYNLGVELEEFTLNKNVNSGDHGTKDHKLKADFTLTAVPEPTTWVAGALLLLPLGVSTIRILRKSRAS
jgi:hypothetical protein